MITRTLKTVSISELEKLVDSIPIKKAPKGLFNYILMNSETFYKLCEDFTKIMNKQEHKYPEYPMKSFEINSIQSIVNGETLEFFILHSDDNKLEYKEVGFYIAPSARLRD